MPELRSDQLMSENVSEHTFEGVPYLMPAQMSEQMTDYAKMHAGTESEQM